jgi:hypothetical protein
MSADRQQDVPIAILMEETAVVNINVELPLTIETMNLKGWVLGILRPESGVACRTFSESPPVGMYALFNSSVRTISIA